MALADTARLIVELALNDKFSGPMKGAQSQLTQLQRSGEQLGKGIRQVGTGFTQLGTRAAVVAAGGLTAVVKTAIDFESAFAGVAKTVEATPAQLEELNEGFRELARTIPLSFEEFAAIGEQAGALGIAREDILEFTEVVAKIGTTTDVTSDQAATALGQLSNVLGITADDFDNFGAALVDLGNKGASTESQILGITSRAGAGAKLIGLTADQTLAWASAVANLGVEVEAGGSALQQFNLQAAKNVESAKTLTLMAKTAGTTGSAFKMAFEKDASGALQDFLVGLGKLDRGAQLQVLDDLNLKGIRLQRVLLGLAGDNDNLTDSLKNSADAWKENAALNEEAQKRYATTASALAIVKNNIRDAANTIGSELLPVVRDLSTEFVEFLNQPGTQAKIKAFAQDLGQGARDLVKAFKAGEFQPFIDTLKGAAGAAKIAFDAFNALPGPIKQVAIAAAIANKATGGAVGLIASGATNIFRGLIGLGGGLLSRGSSPANALWVQSVGGGLGGPGAPIAGGKGALLGLLGRIVIPVAAGLALAELVQAIEPQSISGKQAFDANRQGGLAGFFGAQKPLPVKVVNPGTPQGQFVPENRGGVQQVKTVKGSVDTAITATVTKMHKDIQAALRKGDIAEALKLKEMVDSIRGLDSRSEKRNNLIVAGIGRTNNALSVASRNLQEGNARQREIAQGIREARDRIGTGFARSNDLQAGILRKPSSFTTNAYVTTNITATLSAYQSLQMMTRVNTVRHTTSPDPTNTGGSV